MTVNGKIYGFPDDGDVFVMYYRKDIFARADLQKAFKAKYKYDLAPPKTWKQFDEIGSFLTEQLKSEGIYGASLLPRAALHAVHVRGALPQRGRQVLRRQHHEGDGQQPGRRARCSPRCATRTVHAAGRGEVRLRREPRGVPQGRERDDHLLAAVRPLRRRLPGRREGARLGAEVADRRQGRLRAAAGRPSRAGRRLRAVGGLDQQAEGAGLPVHPVAEQRGDQQPARAAALRAARPVPRLALHRTRTTWRCGRTRRTTWPRCRRRPRPACSTCR